MILHTVSLGLVETSVLESMKLAMAPVQRVCLYVDMRVAGKKHYSATLQTPSIGLAMDFA